MTTRTRTQTRDLFFSLQDEITEALAATDGETGFREDAWEHRAGGGGRSRVIENGAVFEKGGVNVSAVEGPQLPPSVVESVPAATGLPFFATGISIVLHPISPHVPTIHMNTRYFEAGEDGEVWWFGGGIDLTPYYPRREDVVHFHKTLQSACNASDESFYPAFKTWCDEYFHIKHRKEQRGVGGIFFDYVGRTETNGPWDGRPFDPTFEFVERVGRGFLESYLPIVERRREEPVTDDERWFQEYRRGRYVEFNLVYDRGTLFGLQTGGRIESILMSLPPRVRYVYDWKPTAGTPEAELYETYLQPQDWASQS